MTALSSDILSVFSSIAVSPTSVNPTLLSIDLALLLSLVCSEDVLTFSSNFDVKPFSKSLVWTKLGFSPCVVSCLTAFIIFPFSLMTLTIFVSGFAMSRSSRSIGSASIPTGFPTNDALSVVLKFSLEVEAVTLAVVSSTISTTISSIWVKPNFFSDLIASPVCLTFTVSVETTSPSWGAVLKCIASSIFSSSPTFLSTDLALLEILDSSFLTKAAFLVDTSFLNSGAVSLTSLSPTLCSIDFTLLLSFLLCDVGSIWTCLCDLIFWNSSTLSYSWLIPCEVSFLRALLDSLFSL